MTTDARPVEAPKESAAQKNARDRRKRLAHVLDALKTSKVAPLKPLGAALFASHLDIEIGTEALAKLSAAKVEERAAAFRARYPAAWGAAAGCNVVGFVRFLKMIGARDKSEPSAALVAEYQASMSELAAA
jgi:hypothetical protein